MQIRIRNAVQSLRYFSEFVIALWMYSFFFVTYCVGGDNPHLPLLLFASLAGGVAVVLLLVARRSVCAKVPDSLSAAVLILNVAIACSYLVNMQRYELSFMLGNMLSSWLMFLGLYAIVTRTDLDFRLVLIIHCILASALFPFVWARSQMVWGRLITTNLTPNFVGMIALVCLMGALSVRSKIGVLALAIIPSYTMWAFQSRAALLTACVAVAVIALIQARRTRSGKTAFFAFALVTVVCVLAASGLLGRPFSQAIDYIAEDVFKLNDKYRGFSSGASGRSDIWGAAYELWIENPLFGVGFKGHQKWMPDQSYAHNAYLATLADIGVLGCFGYLLMIGVTFYYLFRRSDVLPGYPQRAAIMLGYVLYGLLETHGFGLGNSYSIIFLLVAFDSSKQRIIGGNPEGQSFAKIPMAQERLATRQ